MRSRQQGQCFELPDEKPQIDRSTYSYAYHFECGVSMPIPRRWAPSAVWSGSRPGLRDRAGQCVGRDHRDHAQIGSPFRADLFIDCTGFSFAASRRPVEVGWEGLDPVAPLDRALAMPLRPWRDFTPYTRPTGA